MFWNKKKKSEDHFQCGRVYARSGRYDKATIEFIKALHQGHPQAKEGIELGLKYLEANLPTNHGKAVAHYNVGTAFYYEGMLDEAIKQLEMAIKLDTTFAWAYSTLGLAYVKKGENYRGETAENYFDLAIVRCKKAIELAVEQKVDFPEAHNNLGLAYSYKGLIHEAIEEYQKALALNPNYIEAKKNLAMVKLKKILK